MSEHARRLALWIAPLGLVAALAIAPLATGARTLFLRDVLNTHYALRIGLAESLRALELPLVDATRGGGQGLAGNPNALPFYPDNLLLIFGETPAITLWQLNAHFWLHGLVALVAMYALARRWGLGFEGAFAAATVYGASGYLLSQMNLYNGVAGAALAPALAATLLGSRSDASKRSAAGFGALWALELLAGDPVLAGIALLAALALAWPERKAIAWGRVALGLALGTLVAAPQAVEMLRLLPGSFRGYWGNDPAALVKTTPDPRALLDLLLPLYFERPDRIGMWAGGYFGGAPPLYYSLAPGLVALAAAAAGTAGARADRRVRAAILLGVAAGILAYSRPWLGEVLARMPGGGLFRFPAKFALGAAIAGALLAGRGLERFAAGQEIAGKSESSRAPLLRSLALFVALAVALFVLFAARGNPLEGAWRALFAAGLADSTFESLRREWSGIALLQVVVGLAAIAALALARRRWAALGGLVLAAHAASQLFLLRPMLPTDEAARYRRPPALLERVDPAAVLVHGGATGTFVRGYPAWPEAEDRQSFRLFRRAHAEAIPFAGRLDGRRYELDISPEGLDSFLVQAMTVSLPNFDDARRLRVLAATGVDLLLLPRPLELEALGEASLALRTEGFEGAAPLHLYALREPLEDAQLLGTAVFAPHVGAGLNAVFDPRFAPRRVAVVAGEGTPREGPPGTTRIERFAAEEIALEVDSERGGFVVVRRAWLPIWEAELDGAPARPLIANLTRLAVEVPPGPHRVRFFVSRTPLRLALLGSLFGVAGLLVLAFGSRRAVG